MGADPLSRGSTKAIPGSGSGAGLSTDYVYTEENRLSTVEGGVAAGGVSLSYDPLGRLYQVASPSGTRRFRFDPGSRSGAGFHTVIGEYDGTTGAHLHRCIHGAGADERSPGTTAPTRPTSSASTPMPTSAAA